MTLAHHLHGDTEIGEVTCQYLSTARIGMMRNGLITRALQPPVSATHILMIDPDMVPDRYLGSDERAKPFWSEAWPFILDNPNAIAAAPYCGEYPERKIHVFADNEAGKSVRVTHVQAARLEGWQEVRGVGTGLMLMNAGIFRKMRQPWFDDSYTDRTHTELRRSQDVLFCEKASAAGIPTYVNFDCPCGHWQNSVVDMPGWTPPGGQPQVAQKKNPSIPKLIVPGEGDAGSMEKAINHDR